MVTKKISGLNVGSTCQECVDVPQPQMAPNFNLPHSPGNDIFCAVLRVPENLHRCLDLSSTCTGFTETIFSSSVTICSTNSSSDDYKMCFSNLTTEMNGTKVHFFYSEDLLCDTTSETETSRLYVDSYEIVVQGMYM